MRNRWGVELKRGYYAWATQARGGKVEGTIVAIDRASSFARAYGPQVKLDSGITVGADDISQVLPPMRVTSGGVVKANPADIHIDIDSHNTKGRNVRASNPVTEARELWLYARNIPLFVNAARDAFQSNASAAEWRGIALLAARRYSQEFGSGVTRWRDIFTDDDLSVVATMLRDDMQNEAEDDSAYASNPLARTYPDALSQRPHIGRNGKPTKRPSARLVERRLKTASMPMPGVWANPLVRVKVGSRSMATKSPPDSRLRNRRRLTDKAPPGFYANPDRGFTFRFANVENDGGFSFGMDNVTPVTFVLSERERKGRAWYRSFRLPDALIKSPQFQLWADSHRRIVASLNDLKRMLQPFMPE